MAKSEIISSDEQLNKEFDFLLNEVLATDKDKIYIPYTQENLTIPEIISKIKNHHNFSRLYLAALFDYLLHNLPLRWNRTRDEIKFILRKKLINIEEVMEENEALVEENQKLTETVTRLQNSLEERNKDTKQILDFISKKEEKKEEPIKKEVKKHEF